MCTAAHQFFSDVANPVTFNEDLGQPNKQERYP